MAGHSGMLDGFLAVLTPDLGQRDYASFVAGGNWDVLRAVAVGPDGQIAAPARRAPMT